MAKTKTKQAKAAIPYARRAVEDEYVQEQVRKAVAQLRDVYKRASREGGKASKDNQLYAKVREAATSARRAVGAIEEPPQPKRRGRKLLVLAAVTGIVGLLLRKGTGSLQPDPGTTNADTHAHEPRASEPVAGAPAG
jgi:hypothetical protein